MVVGSILAPLAQICLISLHLSRAARPALLVLDGSPMKITAIETTVLRLPEVKPIGDGCQSILLIRIRTDEGITGIGEVHTNPTVTKAIIDAPLLRRLARPARDPDRGEPSGDRDGSGTRCTRPPPSMAGGAR